MLKGCDASMVRKYVSNAEKRRAESRKVILDAAVELFFTKGYEETTTRDIIMKAGILNGSLYNRFKSKDEILYTVFEEAFKDALDQLKGLLEKDKNPVIIINLPAALEIYMASRNPKVAELFYQVHRSWDVMESYIGTYTEWADSYLKEYGLTYGDDPMSGIKIMSVLGGIGNICGYYANGGTADYREVMTNFVGIVCGLFNVHVFDTAKLVDSICRMIEESDITIYGHKLNGNSQ